MHTGIVKEAELKNRKTKRESVWKHKSQTLLMDPSHFNKDHLILFKCLDLKY